MTKQSEQPILYEELGDHVVRVTLNRPQVRNAVNGRMAMALAEAFGRAEADPEVWAVILTGSGSVFSAGADLREVADGKVKDLFTPEGGFAGFVHAPHRKVWIAAANGPAVAGGLELLLACDLAIAAEGAFFGLPEVKRGLVAAAGGAYRLVRALPKAVAMEMIATGDPIDASRALKLGLVSRVTEPAALQQAALDLARSVCANAPVAVRESLDLARAALDCTEEELRHRSAAAVDYIDTTADFSEGARAFLERRPPRWTGR